MDDVLSAPLKDEVEEYFGKINSFHPMLKFTMEREVEGRLPFLDLCIVHTGSNVYTTWYTKLTDTGLVMNFYSLAPRKYKCAVVQGLVPRIYRACSTWGAVLESLERAKAILERNQYPPEMYDPIITMTLEKIILDSKGSSSSTTKSQREDTEPGK